MFVILCHIQLSLNSQEHISFVICVLLIIKYYKNKKKFFLILLAEGENHQLNGFERFFITNAFRTKLAVKTLQCCRIY